VLLPFITLDSAVWVVLIIQIILMIIKERELEAPEMSEYTVRHA
jgi:hypothetical protein